MVTAGDFRNGVTFELDGNVMQIIESSMSSGKGAAVRTKIRNVITGSVTERTFSPTDKLKTRSSTARICSIPTATAIFIISWIRKPLKCCLSTKKLGDSFEFVKENDICRVMSYKGKVFVEPPMFVTLEIIDTSPASAAIPLPAQPRMPPLKPEP